MALLQADQPIGDCQTTSPAKSRGKPAAGFSLALEDNHNHHQLHRRHHHQRRNHRQANNENVMNKPKRLGAKDEGNLQSWPLNQNSVCQVERAAATLMNRIPFGGGHHSLAGNSHKESNATYSGSSGGGNLQQRWPGDGRGKTPHLEEQENMTRPRESQSQGPQHFITGPSSASSRREPKISKRNSSTNNNNEHSSSQAKINNQMQQRQQQQQLIVGGGAGRKSKPAGVSAAGLFSSLPLCLGLFALSLFSSTTITLVNGIRLQPEGKEKFYWSGEQFVITCQNNNNIKNVKIRWTGPDGNVITENRKERIHVESNGVRLVVNNTQLVRDDGVYTCTITEGQRPRESAEFSLKVLKETSFKNTAKHVTLKAGTRGQVDCMVEFDESVTTASVTWLKNQQPVDLFNDTSIRVQDYDPSRQLSSLIFAPVKREHEDEYTCQATAVSPNLSKIIDYKIQVETQFGPIFDSPEQTIWVESIQAINSRLHHSGAAAVHSGSGAGGGGSLQQQAPTTIPHRNMFSASTQRGRGGRLRPASQPDTTSMEPTVNGAPHSGVEQVVRVELKCTCQANPDANILWFANSNQNFAINKGAPEQVIEEPYQVRSGHNVTSTLVVAYNLDPNWERRHEKYKCSASNLLDTAEKFFTIEQGNPPPAFLVGPYKSYSQETSVFNFTLLGPVSGGSESTNEPMIGSLASIVPPVDSFRIRAESGPAFGGVPVIGAGGPHPGHHASQAAELRSISHLRRQGDQSVQWAYALGPDVSLPLNMSVKLGNLPSGVQRLFLEAHNAVGHSPNATYLGEFNLVSSGFSSVILDKLSCQDLLILLAGQLIAMAGYLMKIPHF